MHRWLYTAKGKNSAMEKFFGSLKSESLYRTEFSNPAEVERAVAKHGYFHNFERINIKDGHTPHETRSKAV